MKNSSDPENLRITFRHMDQSDKLHAVCEAESQKLMDRHGKVESCRVQVTREPAHHDAAFEVSVTLELKDRSVSAYPPLHPHESAEDAIRRAFSVARRRLLDGEDRKKSIQRRAHEGH